MQTPGAGGNGSFNINLGTNSSIDSGEDDDYYGSDSSLVLNTAPLSNTVYPAYSFPGNYNMALPQNSWASLNPLNYISISFSSTSPSSYGETISGGLTYPTRTAGSFGGASLDLLIGDLPKSWETVNELAIGPFGRYLGVGTVNSLDTNRQAIAFHFGIGFAFPITDTVTFPTVDALPPSFHNDFQLGWYQNRH